MHAAETVSVCVPTIGRSWLTQTLASAVRQSLLPHEIVILDNGCGVEVQEALCQFASEHAHVRVVRSETRLPIHENFNKGLLETSGRFISFMHDDDMYGPDFLARSIEMLVAHPTLGFVGSNCRQIGAEGIELRARNIVARSCIAESRTFIRRVVRSGRSPLSLPGIVFRREALVNLPFTESILRHHGDVVHMLRIAEAWDVGLIADSLWSMRIHEDSFTQSIPAARAILFGLGVLREYVQQLLARGDDYVDGQDLKRASDRMTGLAWLMAGTPSEAHEALSEMADHGSRRMHTLCRLLHFLHMRGAAAQAVPVLRWISTRRHE